MTILALYIFALSLLMRIVSCSENALYEELKNDLKNSICQNFYPALTRVVEKDEMFLPLWSLTGEINSLFLTRSKVKETIFNELQAYLNERLYECGFQGTREGNYLLSALSEICEESRIKHDLKRRLLTSKNALNTMADICYHFKVPVQWLVLTSRSLGQGKLFKDAPVLLEIIRKAFLEKFDPKTCGPVDFEDKLNFIKVSFEFYISQCDTGVNAPNYMIYKDLKAEFLNQLNWTIAHLKSTENPFVLLKTGLGISPIVFDFRSDFNTSNEDLWGFVIQRIKMIREEVELSSLNLINCHEIRKSIIDIIISNILEKSHEKETFTLKSAHILIKSTFDTYACEVESIFEHEVAILKAEYDSIKMIIEANLAIFTEELEAKVLEIKSKYRLINTDNIDIDFRMIAFSSMAEEHMSELTKSGGSF